MYRYVSNVSSLLSNKHELETILHPFSESNNRYDCHKVVISWHWLSKDHNCMLPHSNSKNIKTITAVKWRTSNWSREEYLWKSWQIFSTASRARDVMKTLSCITWREQYRLLKSLQIQEGKTFTDNSDNQAE